MLELRNDGDKNITTIAVWKSTKDKLDRNKAPGQCYNGFICQLVDLWEDSNKESIFNRAGSVGGNQGAKGPVIPY